MKFILKYPSIIFVLLITMAYSSLILGRPTVNPDAQIIIPNLKSFLSIENYFEALISFNTIDFQPLRDLSFFVDISLFDKFRFNTFVLQNILWWIGCGLLIFNVSKKIFPKKDTLLLLLVSISFCLYPLFSYVLSWGIARKHIMAFFFVLLATDIFLKTTRFDTKRSLLIAFIFLLSILSHPIGIFWPLWIFFFFFLKKTSLKNSLKLVIPLILIQSVFLFINYHYYTTSKTFLFHYAPKDSNLFELGDKVLALGHYNFQLFFPYLLSFTYDLGHISVLIGLVFFLLLGFVFYKKKNHLALNISYIIWGWGSFLLTLGNPHQLYDTYLLLPSFSIFLLLLSYLPDHLTGRMIIFMFVMLAAEGIQCFSESKKWLSTVDLTESSFYRRPSCKNAINYARISYENYKIPSLEVKEFMKLNECLKNVVLTDFNKTTHLNFLSYILFHENFFTIEERLIKLEELSKQNLISYITKAAFLLKIGREDEADKVIKYFIEKIKDKRISSNKYNFISAKIVHPYCQKKKWDDCLKVITPMSIKKNAPYL